MNYIASQMLPFVLYDMSGSGWMSSLPRTKKELMSNMSGCLIVSLSSRLLWDYGSTSVVL